MRSMASITGYRQPSMKAAVVGFLIFVLVTATLNSISAEKTGTEQKTVLQECFDVVVDKMSADWKSLGYVLGLSHNHLEGIGNVSLLDPDTCCRAVLEKWREIRGKEATKASLIKAIRSVHREDVAEVLEDLSSKTKEPPQDIPPVLPRPSIKRTGSIWSGEWTNLMAVIAPIVVIMVLSAIFWTCCRKNRAKEVFICHTSEDKEAFVRPLVTELIAQGVPQKAIFYDELSLRTGDRLTDEITSALRSPSLKLFVFVISNRVLDNPNKIWPKYEFSFANALEKRIFPIWLGENDVNWDEFKEKVDKWNKLADPTNILSERVKVGEIKNKLSGIAKDIKSQLDSPRENKKDL